MGDNHLGIMTDESGLVMIQVAICSIIYWVINVLSGMDWLYAVVVWVVWLGIVWVVWKFMNYTIPHTN